MNATTHGLRARVRLPDEIQVAAERYKADLLKKYQPKNSEQEFWVGDLARCMAQLDRCFTLRLGALKNDAYAAENQWGGREAVAAEKLGTRLSKQPTLVTVQLEQTLYGAQWKIYRWQGIRDIILEKGSANGDLRSLACDLFGLPKELRSASFEVPPVTDSAGLLALAEDEIARLEELKVTVLEARDTHHQAAALAAMPMEESPETRKYRLYEALLRREIRRTEAKLVAACLNSTTASAGAGARSARGAAASSTTAEDPKPRPTAGRTGLTEEEMREAEANWKRIQERLIARSAAAKARYAASQASAASAAPADNATPPDPTQGAPPPASEEAA
jgi:hypothetical protein